MAALRQQEENYQKVTSMVFFGIPSICNIILSLSVYTVSFKIPSIIAPKLYLLDSPPHD
jgi:hypothetical protein